MVQQQTPTFIGAAKLRNQNIGSVVYDGGNNVPVPIQLLNTGYLSRLRLTQTHTGEYATAAPLEVDPFAPAGGPVSRWTVRTNSVAVLFDCDAFMTAVIGAINGRYEGGPSEFPLRPNVFWPSPDLATVWSNEWSHQIPIALHMSNKPWPVGLFQTALNSLQIALETRFLPTGAVDGVPGSGLYVPGASATYASGHTPSGSLQVQQQYFDPIAAPAAQPSLAWIHQWSQFQVPLTGDGDLTITLPPSNYYLRVIFVVVTGAAGELDLDNENLTNLQLRYGANLTPYDEPLEAVKARMFHDYGFRLPAGVYTSDFIQTNHTEQNWIDSGQTTNLRQILHFSGASYNSSYVNVAVEQLLPLTGASAGSPMVQGVAA